MEHRYLAIRVHSDTRNNRFRLIREALATETTDESGPDGIPMDQVILVGHETAWTNVVTLTRGGFSGALMTDRYGLKVERRAMTTHLDPRHTDAEMLRACTGLRSDTVRQLVQRLAQRGEIARDVRQRMETIKPLLAAGSLAQALATIDRCRADLDWCFTAPDYPDEPRTP